ncbi:unnamed protein product [Moneuplotes crassus]|uniref:Uncharacterized protein n=1 Tax=Euplotes crassus TaxID=5936 RepID=A0AAD2D692_EUPCR|nr:unnamed protein product [Moneuplotes crassus]
MLFDKISKRGITLSLLIVFIIAIQVSCSGPGNRNLLDNQFRTNANSGIRLEQTPDEEHHDDFIDAMKGTLSVSIGSAIIIILLGYTLYILADKANLAQANINNIKKDARMKLIKKTWEYCEANAFVEKGFYPF